MLLTEFFDLTGEFTLGAHAKDFTVMPMQLMVRFEEAEIGSGMLDHVTFLQGMQRVCPTGHVLIEHLPPERYADAAVEYHEVRVDSRYRVGQSDGRESWRILVGNVCSLQGHQPA